KTLCAQSVFPATIDFYSTCPWGNSQWRPAPAPPTWGGRNRPYFRLGHGRQPLRAPLDIFFASAVVGGWAAGSCAGGGWGRPVSGLAGPPRRRLAVLSPAEGTRCAWRPQVGGDWNRPCRLGRGPPPTGRAEEWPRRRPPNEPTKGTHCAMLLAV